MSPELEKIIRQNVQDESTFRAISELITQNESTVPTQLDYLSILHQLTTSHYDNLDALFMTYLRAGCDIFGVEQGAIRQIVHETTVTQAIYPQSSVPTTAIPLNDLMCRYVSQHRQTVANHNISADQVLHEDTKVACYIGTPLIIDNMLWGTISFHNSNARHHYFTNEEIQFIELLAQNISHAINSYNDQQPTQKHYSFVFENIDTPILMYDVDSYDIIEANPAAIEFYGYSYEEFCTLSLIDINMLPSGDIESMINQSRALDQPYVNFPHRLKFGEVREVADYTNEMILNNRRMRFSIIYDYSDRHEAEEALKHSEANLRAIFDNTSQLMFLVDDTANIVAMNRAAEQLNELIEPNQSSKSETLHSYHIKADRYLVSKYIDRALQGESISYESMLTHKNGQPLYINYRYTPVKTPDDEIIGVSVTGQDITSLKMSQDALSRERNLLRALIDNLPDAIWIKDEKARLLNANQAYITQANVSSLSDIIGKTVLEIFTNAGEEYYQDDMLAISEDRVITKEVYRTLSDDKIGLSIITKIPLHGEYDQVIGMVGVGRDITAQREMENALHRRDEILSTINDAAQKFLKDANWRDRMEEIIEQLGRSLEIERVYLKRNVDFVTGEGAIIEYEWSVEGIPEYHTVPVYPTIPRWSNTLKNGELLYGHYDDMRPDEQERMLAQNVRSFVVAPVMVDSQWWGSLGFDAIHSDRHWHPYELEALATAASTLGAAIQRELIEKGLRDNEEKFNQLVTHIPEAFWIFDVQEQQLIYSNRNYETIFGISIEERQQGSKLLLEKVHPEDQASVIEGLDFQSRGEVSQRETRFLEDNGGTRWVSIRTYPIYDDDGTVKRLAGIASDITEQKQVEAVRLDMLAQQERISILSSFFRDASHEFKTPLSIINTSVYILGKTEDAQTRQQHSNLIQQQVRDISDLVETLVLMSRLDSRTELTFAPLNMNSIMRQTHLNLSNLYPHRDHDFQLILDNELPLILGHVNYITQAIGNLVDNAVRYSNLGDAIYLRTYHNDTHVIIEVQDEGIGIPNNILSEIFKRFYRGDEAHSTRGFGLGLPIAQRIAQRHGGEITVESAYEQGSIFRMVFPMIKVLNE